MPRACTVCTHGQRAAIDQAVVAGETFRYVAERFGTSTTAVFRHKADHLPAMLVQAQAAKDVAHADSLLDQLATLQADARRIGQKAETTGDLRTALAGIRELVRITELTATLIGELDERPQVNVLLAPEWLQVRAALLEALLPYPEARQAVARRLVALEASA
jgi:hypothetical protein